MGNACAGPQAKERAAAERRQEAALSLAAARGDPGPLPVLQAQPYQAAPYAATATSAAPVPTPHDPHYEAQLQQAIQQSQYAGPSLLPRQAEDDAAVLAAIAASEAEAARMRLEEEEQDAELQAALRASEREISVVPGDFNGTSQASRAFADDPFADDPFADEPQPQPAPAPAPPQQFDAFAALREASASTPPKKSPQKVSLKAAGDQFFNDMAAPLLKAVEWIGTVTQRDFAEYTAGEDDFELGSNLMMFVSIELHDGVLLCTLLNTLFPGTVADVDEGGTEGAIAKNFEGFSAGCRKVGVPVEQVFTSDDLKADPEVVVPCILALQSLRPTASATPI